MKKLAISSLIVGLMIIIGISIWVGFPSPNFNRAAIVTVGYIIGIGAIFIGTGMIADLTDKL